MDDLSVKYIHSYPYYVTPVLFPHDATDFFPTYLLAQGTLSVRMVA